MTIIVPFMLSTASDEYDKQTDRSPKKEKEEDRKRKE